MQGNVLRWHEEHGTTQMPATEYIAMLEKELTALRKQVRILLDSLARFRLAWDHSTLLQEDLTQMIPD